MTPVLVWTLTTHDPDGNLSSAAYATEPIELCLRFCRLTHHN